MKINKTTTSAIKGISIIAVIVIHLTTTGNLNSFFGKTSLILNQYARFAVPFFIILSGYGLEVSKKYTIPIIPFLKGRLVKLLPAYVLWNLIYFLIIHRTNFNLGLLLSGMLLGNISPQMYYVPVLLLLYVTYPVLRRMSKNWKQVLFWLSVTFISQTLSIFWVGTTLFGLNILNWAGYFVLGIFLANKEISMFAKNVVKISIVFVPAAILVGILGFAGYGATNFNPFVVPYAWGLFFMLYNWRPFIDQEWLILLGEKSYTIYLAHWLFVRVVGGVIPVKGIPSLIFVLLIVLVLSVITDVILSKIKRSLQAHLGKRG